MDANDKHSLRLAGWKEARGDGIGAVDLVIHVLLNCVGRPGFARTLHDAIFGKNQITSMSVPSDPEFNLEPAVDDATWVATEWIVDNLEDADDATGGALWYQNPKTAQRGGWFERNVGGSDGLGVNGHKVLLVYKHHTFYS